jgi:hypothetical protein
VPGVVEDARPRVFGFAADDRVGMPRGFIGKGRRVSTAEDDRHAAAPEFAGEAVGVPGRGGRGGDADQIDRRVEADTVDDFVRVRDGVLPRREGRDERHGELRELDQAAAAQAARLERFCRDQVDAHDRYTFPPSWSTVEFRRLPRLRRRVGRRCAALRGRRFPSYRHAARLNLSKASRVSFS